MLLLQFTGVVFADGGITVSNATTISADSTGTPGNAPSSLGGMTPDGRYVIFDSEATNLIPGLTIPTYSNGTVPQLYELDRQNDSIQIVGTYDDNADPVSSISMLAVYAGVSDNGRYIAFGSTSQDGVYLRDTITKTTTKLVSGPSGTTVMSMSGDGSRILYYVPGANYLIPGKNYLYDTASGNSTLLPSAIPLNDVTISKDGKYIVYGDGTSLLLYDIDTGQTATLLANTGRVFAPTLSSDDSLVSYYTNDNANLYVYHIQTGENQLIWQNTIAQTHSVSISANDRVVSFLVFDPSLSNKLYVEDLATGSQTLVDNNPYRSTNTQLSSDGTQLAFSTPFSNAEQVVVTQLSLPSPTPSAPTNLTAPSPTQYPQLSWDAVSAATFYNIYRNGTLIDTISSSNTSYTDNTAPLGTNSYYVTAVNAAGESDPSNTVTVSVVDPTPVVGAIAAPTTVAKNTSLSASASFTYPITSDTHTATWNWGDGNTTNGTVSENNGSGSVSDTHTYSAAGSYTVTLTVTDENGNSGTSQFTVAVSPATNGSFQNAQIAGLNFDNANFSNVNLTNVHAQNTSFQNVNFTSADVSNAQLQGANLTNANFTGANLQNAQMQNTNLAGANFTNANLHNAHFNGATLTGVTWSNTICPDNTNSDSHGMTCVGHGGGL